MVVASAQRSSVRLPAEPASIGAARSAVRSTLRQWDLDAVVDTATLLVSELATNVLLHVRSDFEVRIERVGADVRVTVLDTSARTPTRRRYGLEAGTGRGLGLVDTLAADWGVTGGDGTWSKGVWFSLPQDGTEREAPEGALFGDDWLALVGDL